MITACEICGAKEPFHIHDTINYSGLGKPVIMDYFTIGRYDEDIAAAREWRRRAEAAEAVVDKILEGKDTKKQLVFAGISNLGKRYLEQVPA